LLESVRKQTKLRTVDLYKVFCGVLYLLKSGCQWRMLPSEYPKWRTVHAYFAKWSDPSPGWRSVGGCGKNCERKLNTSLQFILLAFLVLLLRRA